MSGQLPAVAQVLLEKGLEFRAACDVEKICHCFCWNHMPSSQTQRLTGHPVATW